MLSQLKTATLIHSRTCFARLRALVKIQRARLVKIQRAATQEYHDKLKAALWDQAKLGVRPSHTWNEAVVRYLAETSHKASHEDDKRTLRWLDQHLGGADLAKIDREVVERITAAKLSEKVKHSSVNRMLEVVRAILRKSMHEWEWTIRVPKIRMLPEPKRRVRWITRIQADELMAALPKHLTAMVRFSLETGLRRANVTGLQWTQVDLARRCAWIHADQAKARKPIAVPLSNTAVVVVREQLGKHRDFVFTYRKKPVRQVNTKAWRAALKRVGIEDFRWHDLRHTWASWHAQSGTPLNVLQELGGWETAEMVRRYAHLSSSHLAEYVDRMSGGLKLVKVENVATI